VELLIALHGEDHADKHPSDQYDGDAADADFVHRLDDDDAAWEASKKPAEHRRGKQRKVTDRLDELDHELSERVNYRRFTWSGD